MPRLLRTSFLVYVLSVACGGTVSSTPSDGGTTDSGTGGDSSTVNDGTTSLDGGADGTTVLPDGAPFDYCKALADRATKCGDGFDPVRCARDQGCADRAMKPEDGKSYLYCLATRACGTKDDDCLIAAAAKYTGDPTVDAYVKACLEKRSGCSGSGTSIPDDYCGAYHGILLPDLLAKIRACMDKPCGEVRTCYDSVVASVGCK